MRLIGYSAGVLLFSAAWEIWSADFEPIEFIVIACSPITGSGRNRDLALTDFGPRYLGNISRLLNTNEKFYPVISLIWYWHAAVMSGSARNCLWHLSTSALGDTAVTPHLGLVA